MADSKLSQEDWIEAEVARYRKSVVFTSLPEDLQEIAEGMVADYRKRLQSASSPSQFLAQKLARYHGQPDGSLSIPENEPEDRALAVVLKEHAAMRSTLDLIAQGGLSSESETLYADGGDPTKRTPGNAIFTPAQIARERLSLLTPLI